MNYNYFIAKRYLFSKREFKFISFINLISIIGISSGVIALIIVMSILNGFQEITEDKIMSFDPHLSIKYESKYEADIINYLQESTEVDKYAKVNTNDIVLMVNNNSNFLKVKSYQDRSSQAPSNHSTTNADLSTAKDTDKNDDMMQFFNSSLILGQSNNSQNKPNLIIGIGVANSMKLMPGTTVDVYSVEMIEYSLRTYRNIQPIKAYISGVFQSGNPEYDNFICIGNSLLNQKLSNKDANKSIEVKINDPYQANEFKIELLSRFPQAQINTWFDLNSGLLNIMKFEKVSTFIILSLVIVIAVFNLLASLSMTVENKLKDIGVLRSMGFTQKDIKIVFSYEGMLNGLLGTLIGLLVGIVLCQIQISYELIRLDVANVVSNTLPLSLKLADILLVAFVSIVLSYLSILYPASKASKIDISDALR